MDIKKHKAYNPEIINSPVFNQIMNGAIDLNRKGKSLLNFKRTSGYFYRFNHRIFPRKNSINFNIKYTR